MKGSWLALLGLGALGLAACDARVQEADLAQTASEIVGGEIFTGLPAVGMILYSGSPHCSATLIDKRKVLTAAHCVSGFSASKMKFVIGKSLGSIEHSLVVASAKAHPSWDSQALRNDVGLLTLAQDAPIAPLGINRSGMSSWVGKQLFFVGYGVTNGSTQTGAGTKRAVWMKIATVESTIFTYSDPGKNTCNGDSGGPAFTVNDKGEYLVAGITSYGDWSCTEMGADTRVDAFLDFIGAATTPPSDPCNGETLKGRCSGNKLIWCEGQQVNQKDCAAEGKTCALDSSTGRYACLSSSTPPADSCQGETFEGRCSGNTVIWCEDGQVKQQSCGWFATCGYNEDKGYYDCI